MKNVWVSIEEIQILRYLPQMGEEMRSKNEMKARTMGSFGKFAQYLCSICAVFMRVPYKESLLFVYSYGSQHICFTLKRGEGCKSCDMIAISSTGFDGIRYSGLPEFQNLPGISRNCKVGRWRARPGRFGRLRRMKAKCEGCEGGIIKLSRPPSQLISILGGIIQVEEILF